MPQSHPISLLIPGAGKSPYFSTHDWCRKVTLFLYSWLMPESHPISTHDWCRTVTLFLYSRLMPESFAGQKQSFVNEIELSSTFFKYLIENCKQKYKQKWKQKCNIYIKRRKRVHGTCSKSTTETIENSVNSPWRNQNDVSDVALVSKLLSLKIFLIFSNVSTVDLEHIITWWKENPKLILLFTELWISFVFD